MRSSVIIASAGLALSAGTALAEFNDIQLGNPTLLASWQIGSAGHPVRFFNPSGDPGTAIYDMEDDPTINPNAGPDGSFTNGGSAVQAGNTITRLVADAAHTVSYTYGSYVSRFYFSVANNNAQAVSARPRVRFWYDQNGANPGFHGESQPGNYYGVGGNIGFSFNPISFAANSLNLFYTDLGAGTWPLLGTQSTMWLGMTFDNNTGGTGATAAQMNLLGQVTVGPSPLIGDSADRIFRTTAAGSFFTTANPAGTVITLSPTTYNLAWELIAQVPAPSSVALLGLGGLITARRRRS